MTPDMWLILLILALAVVLLVTEWIPMEVTALLAIGAVYMSGLLKASEALAGFSNPAVVTIWAVFIISGGLTRTGAANILGRAVLRMAGQGEAMLIVVIMITAGVLSAVMNNVAVAALMLPVAMDVARKTGTPPSRLLLPLAYGSLLGGLTTQIGTPPNILVTEALLDAGLPSFSFFDFTPIGLTLMLCGTAFMALVGRHLLPRGPVEKSVTGNQGAKAWQDRYRLEEYLLRLRVPLHSALIGRTLAQTRIGSALGLNVIAITRAGGTLLSPQPTETIEADDLLLAVQGSAENTGTCSEWCGLIMETRNADILDPYFTEVKVAEMALEPGSPFIGQALHAINFHDRFKATVLALRRGATIHRTALQDRILEQDDLLLVAGRFEDLEALKGAAEWGRFRYVDRTEIMAVYRLHEHLLLLRVPPDAALSGKTLMESRLGDALGSRVLGVLRGDEHIFLPESDQRLQPEDRLILAGRPSQFAVLQALGTMPVESADPASVKDLVSEPYGVVEAILSPHSKLEQVTLRQLRFREKYGLNVLALWRGGKVLRTGLRDMALRFGDALLLFGPRDKLRLLGQEPDFIVLTETAQEPPRLHKMKISVPILVAVLFPVLMGWMPIYIAAVVGAALMVLTGCLTMEEAYRQIEWKAVFLIAGILPLGVALDQTGAAGLIAQQVVQWVGPWGPLGVMFGMVALTFAATCFVPTAALVVLMAPIVLNTSAAMGLSPHGLMMAVAMAASASLITPIAHPANLLVMGPGGYRFLDYFKIGGLLTLVIAALLMLLMPVLWPLVP